MVHHDSFSIDSSEAITGQANNFIAEGPSDFNKAMQIRFKHINFTLTCTNINKTNNVICLYLDTIGSGEEVVYKELPEKNYDPTTLAAEISGETGWKLHYDDSAVTLASTVECTVDAAKKRFIIKQNGTGVHFYSKDIAKESIKYRLINRYIGMDPSDEQDLASVGGELPHFYDLSYPKYITVTSKAFTQKSSSRYHVSGARSSHVLAKIPVNVQSGQVVDASPYRVLQYVAHNSRNIDIQIQDDSGNPLPISPHTKVFLLFEYFNTPKFIPY